MSLLRRCLSLLLCCLLLSCVFSTVVNAEELEIKPYNVLVFRTISGSVTNWVGQTTIYPNNDNVEYNGEISIPISSTGVSEICTLYQITSTDGSIILPRDRQATVKFNDVYHSTLYKPVNKYLRKPTRVRGLITYTNGESEYIDEVEYSQSEGDPTIDLTMTFTPQYDVQCIEFQIYLEYNFTRTGEIISYLGEVDGDSGFKLYLDQQTEEAGFLSGILEWVKSIFEGIGNIFDVLGNIFDFLLELPSKIWGLISDGLKSLFVPSDEFIRDFKDNMDGMLEMKFGAIYQVVDITIESWDRIQVSDETDTIDFPEVTIPLPEGEEFTFGGQSVQIVPDGFNILVTTLKTIVGISCTVLFVNGLRKRYEEIMGGK